MTYSAQLINSSGEVVFDPVNESYSVKTIFNTTAANWYNTGIAVATTDIILVSSLGNTGSGYVWRSPYTGTVYYSTTVAMRVLILSPTSGVGSAGGWGMEIYDNLGKLVFTTTRGIFRIDYVASETPTGNLGVTEYPSVTNVFNTDSLGGTVFLSNTFSPLVAARAYDSSNSNTCGLGFYSTATTIGFKGFIGSGDGTEFGASGVFTYFTGTYYD